MLLSRQEKVWRDLRGCNHTVATECSLDIPLTSNLLAHYLVRVRAERWGETSPWKALNRTVQPYGDSESLSPIWIIKSVICSTYRMPPYFVRVRVSVCVCTSAHPGLLSAPTLDVTVENQSVHVSLNHQQTVLPRLTYILTLRDGSGGHISTVRPHAHAHPHVRSEPTRLLMLLISGGVIVASRVPQTPS